MLIGGILLLTAIVFANSTGNGFIVNWDDDGYIINNPLIQDLSWEGLKTIFSTPHLDNYHPLTTLSNAMELHSFGPDPKPYHVINLLLHLLNTYLVFRFIKSLCDLQTDTLSSLPTHSRSYLPEITAVLFGIHPMHVESVAWLSERKDLLYGFFFIASLIYYLRFTRDKKASSYGLSILMFVCSLLSKPAAVALAPVLIIIDFYLGRKITGKTILEKIPFFALSLGFGILALQIQKASGATDLAPVFPVMERFFLVAYGLVFYIVKAIVPFGLSAIHLYPEPGHLTWVYYAAPVLLCLLAFAVYKAKAMRKEWIFGLLFFLITIILVIQIIPVGRAIVSERYTYIPYIGLFFILGKLYTRLADHISLSEKLTPYLKPALLVYIGILSLITWNRNKDWKNSYSLFSAAIETNPDDYYGYFARARGSMLMNDHAAALADYTEVLIRKPGFAEAYYSRGVVYEKVDVARAIADYTKAISFNPKHPSAYYNRGNLKINAGDNRGAISDYDTTILIRPQHDQSFCNRGVAKFNLGLTHEAILDFNKALAINPKLENAYANRGNAYLKLADTSKACADWRKAVEFGVMGMQKNIDAFCR